MTAVESRHPDRSLSVVREPTWFGLVSLSIVVLAIGIVATSALSQLAYTGVFLERGTSEIIEVDPRTRNAAQFQLGDRVLEIEGVPVGAPVSLRRGQSVGSTLTYRVTRTDETLDLDMQLVAPPQSVQLQRIFTVLLAFTFWSLGTTMFLRRPREVSTRLFLLLSLAIAVVLVTLDLVAVVEPWADVVGYVALIMNGTFFLHFHLYFPHRVPARWRHGLLIYAYVGATILLVAYLVSGVNGLRLQRWYPLYVLIFDFYLLSSFAVGLVLLVGTWRRGDGRTRRRIRVIVVGTLIATLPLIALVLADLFFTLSSVRLEITLLGLVAIPLSYAYALHRDELIESEHRVHRVLISFLLLLALLMAALAVQRFLALVIPSISGSPLAASVAAVAVAFVIAPLRGGIEYAVSRFLYGSAYSYLTVFSDAVVALGDLEPTSLEAVLTRRIPQAMGIEYAAVWAVAADGNTLRRLGGSALLGDPTNLNAPKLAATLASETPFVVRAGKEDSAKHPRWLVPLRLADELVGWWILGPRSNDESLSPVDVRLIDLTARTAALVVKVVSLVQELRAKLAESESMSDELRRAYSRLTVAEERERRRLALELHDDVLQSIYILELGIGQVIRVLPPDAASEIGDNLHAQVVEIVGRIRQVCSGLYPPLLDTMGLTASLDMLAHDLAEQFGITIHLDVTTGRWARPIEVAIYRIAQEALTNVAKHAMVSEARIRVEAMEDQLVLAVQDEGKGFDAEEVGGRRFGLMGMTARAIEVGGALDIESKRGSGTRIVATIPIRCSTE